MNKKLYLTIIFFLSLSLSFCGKEKAKKDKIDETPTPKTENSSPSELEVEKVTPFYVKVNDSLIIRSGPSTNSNKVSCNQFSGDYSLDGKNGWPCGSGCNREVTAFSPGDILQIHEQTKKEVNVGKWTARWYKAKLPDGSNYSCPDFFWVYGKFVVKTNYIPPK